MKIVTVLGARPQFIKAAAVSRAIAEHNQTRAGSTPVVEEVVVHTGQHFDANMSDIFFSELGISKPAFNLNIHGGGHGEMTGRMLGEIETVLLAEKPDYVLVYGDTNSTLAGALAAVKLHIPVAHVEAGLRSFNIAMPEEVNRVLTDRISSVLFCPTQAAVDNLAQEGFQVPQARSLRDAQVINVGDVMYDVALYHGSQTDDHSGILQRLQGEHGVKPRGYCLATVHRAENTDHPQRLECIFESMLQFSSAMPVILPVHPRTRNILRKMNLEARIAAADSLIMIDPVGYLDMVQMEKYAALIATDSGGVQKEAFFYQVPCVTLRDETEWVELVQSGWNRLAPPTSVSEVLFALRGAVDSRGADVKPYGAGDAAQRIIGVLTGKGHA